jgi:hypothetical protein
MGILLSRGVAGDHASSLHRAVTDRLLGYAVVPERLELT